jgi:hypothetical protein
VGFTPGPPEHETECVDVLRPRRTKMHYVTHGLHQMQKHKFDVASPDKLFVGSAPAHPSMKNSASTFENASRPPCGFWMSDDKQLEVQSFIEFCREFSLVKRSMFNQKGKRKGKGSMAQRSKILYFI